MAMVRHHIADIGQFYKHY